MKNEDIISLAVKRMAEAVDADRNNRERGMEDLKFLTGDQWPEEARREREGDSKPVLTINRLPQFVRQVTGDIRRMNPAINVSPASDDATDETAELIEGLIRHIEYNSDASSVYEQTAESAAACSIGWFRVRHDYESDDSFDQEILIERIRNPFSVYCDPKAEDPTRRDAGYVFITEQMSLEEFRKQFPGKAAVDMEADRETDGLEHWHDSGDVVVAEYYWKEPVKKKIGRLPSGEIIENPTAAHNLVQERTVDAHKLMWAKISGKQVLEGPVPQACRNIPVIAVTGEEWHVGDEVYRSDVIRFAKDPQQMYNFSSSAQAEYVALQPKAPFLITAKQVAGYEAFWKEANTKNRPYLPYNPDDKAPPPQRVVPPVSSQGIMEQIVKAGEDMKATTGIYDAGLGNSSDEKSGVAIRQRQMESDVATSIYSDNMGKAIAQCGRVIVEMIPKIYDTARTLRIIGKDEQEKVVEVNQAVFSMDGQQVVNDLTTGRYSVRVSVGPNYSTMRQETAEGMLNFVQAFPPAAGVTADLIAKAQDWPNADQFAERLKTVLPPQVQMLEQADEMDPRALISEVMSLRGQLEQAQTHLASMEHARGMADIEKARAEGIEAQADAQRATVEAQEAAFDFAAKTGLVGDAIQQEVQRQVLLALRGMGYGR